MKSSLERIVAACWQMVFAKLFIYFFLVVKWEDKYKSFIFVMKIKYAMNINKSQVTLHRIIH